MNEESRPKAAPNDSASGRGQDQSTTTPPTSTVITPAFRSRPIALDTGTSMDAANAASTQTISTVEAAILTLLREQPSSDEDLCARYHARSGPQYPKVTDQRLRTARAHLARDGRVYNTGGLAWTSLGHRCTLWGAT